MQQTPKLFATSEIHYRMSKLSDYSKFDHLDSGSESDEEVAAQESKQREPASSTTTPPSASAAPPAVAPPSSTSLPAATFRSHETNKSRFIFEYNSQAVYEWEQTLGEVILYVKLPPFLIKSPKLIQCDIQPHHLTLGQVTQAPFIDEDTFQTVDTSESTWCIEDDSVVIYLTKASTGMVWNAVLKGRFAVTLDEGQQEQVKKTLLLERFQQENPGMDYRDATFNGAVPDPRTFMGGVVK